MAIRNWRFWRRAQAAAPLSAEGEALAPPRLPLPRPAAWSRPFRAVWGVVVAAFEALDSALCAFAIPFGVLIADPGKRFAVMFGVFALIYVLGSLTVPVLSLSALGLGYV